MVTVSAPGKVILMGDHAVVYGKPALVAAIDRRLQVSIELTSSSSISMIDIKSDEETSYVRHVVDVACRMGHIDSTKGMNIRIKSDLKPGYHIGTSAAVAVATVGAVLFAVKKLWNPSQINQIAYEAEKKQHGTPSGVDNTSVTMGGLLWYRKELEFLKSMWQLPIHVTDAIDHFYLIDTGRPPESTGEMITSVRKSAESDPDKFTSIFDENERQTKKLAIAIKESDSNSIITAIKRGNITLQHMGVESTKAITIIHAIEQSAGAAKILGGGGKRDNVGYILAYHESETVLQTALSPYSIVPEKIKIGQDGVRLEQKE
jgi:mevalonate kinase